MTLRKGENDKMMVTLTDFPLTAIIAKILP